MIYFDNAATTFPKPEKVYKMLDDCARKFAVNVGRGQYELTDTATIIVEETRKKLLNYFYASSAKVVFTPSATISINQILRGLKYNNIRNVYISPFEHNAVYRTLNYLKKDNNFNIHILNVSKNPFMYDLDEIKNQFHENSPDLIVISHASNVCGAVAPVETIFKLGKLYGAKTVLDTAQTAGIIDVLFDKWNIDYLIFAGHKSLLSSFGVAGFLIKENDCSLSPLISGGTGYNSINPIMPSELPYKYEAGSLNINAIASLNTSLDFLTTDEYYKYRENEFNVLNAFESIVNENDELQVFGNDYIGERVPVLSIIHEDYSPDEFGLLLNKRNIAIRTGMHCSPLAHSFFGTNPAGTVRFSFGIYNNINEFESFKQLLEEL